MSVLDVLSAAADLGRAQEIASTLVRYGLGDLAHRLGLLKPLELASRALGKGEFDELTPAARVRCALEELGPTFVKFGQLLAARPDLLAEAWIAELGQLHHQVSPLPFEELLDQLREDLGGEPDELFAELDHEPLAAGSIGQVHRATLTSGEPVALKIRRPGIRAVVEADLRLLERLAELAETELPELRRYKPVALVRLFGRQLRNELDFSQEAHNTQALAAHLADDPHVDVPRVHSELTRERLLVLSFVEGLSAKAWMRGERPEGLDGKLLAERGADAILRMIFVDGSYHADPHPGNVFFQAGSRIVLIDCGMIGRLGDARREEFLGLLVAVFRRDQRAVVERLLAWSQDDDELDRDLLTGDVQAFIDRYHGASLAQIDLAQVLEQISGILRDNGLFLPPDVSSLIRVFALLDALGRQLDPEFDLTERAHPIAERAVREHQSPWRAAERQAAEVAGLLRELPRGAREILDRTRRGQLRFEIQMQRLPEFGDRISESANRLTVGMITSALIVGTSIAMTIEGGPTLLGIPALGLLGFVSSAAVGLALLWAILRSGRR